MAFYPFNFVAFELIIDFLFLSKYCLSFFDPNFYLILGIKYLDFFRRKGISTCLDEPIATAIAIDGTNKLSHTHFRFNFKAANAALAFFSICKVRSLLIE
jgi:hypothetical protein